MRARTDRDRLAVWTYEEAGEQIPQGDPSATDAERAAAGRETLAERFEALLPVNRSRAARAYAAGGWPDGQDIVRVWLPRDPAELRARMSEPPLSVWSDDDVLHVVWQGQAAEVQLAGGVQPRLWPVAGTDDLWEVSLRIRRLDEAVISLVVASRQAGGDWPAQIPDIRVWRGPRAAAVPEAQPLRGTVEEHTRDSVLLRTARQVTVYRPPGPGRLVAGCVLADGGRPAGSPRPWRRPSRPAPSRPCCWSACTTPPARPLPGPTCALRSTCPGATAGASTPTSASLPAR